MEHRIIAALSMGTSAGPLTSPSRSHSAAAACARKTHCFHGNDKTDLWQIKATYTKILSCLHPDRVDGDVLKRRFEQVFRLFKDLELLLVAEAEKPLTGMEVPDSFEGLMALRRGRKKGAVRVR